LTIQYVYGFQAAMEQVNVVARDVNFHVVDLFKEVFNGEIVEAAN